MNINLSKLISTALAYSFLTLTPYATWAMEGDKDEGLTSKNVRRPVSHTDDNQPPSEFRDQSQLSVAQESGSSFYIVPDELMLHLFGFLGVRDLVNFGSTSKRNHALANDDNTLYEVTKKAWLEKCPEGKRVALIPTLEYLEIADAYRKIEYPNSKNSLFKSSRNFIKEAFFTGNFPNSLSWFSEKNYEKFKPYHACFLRSFPGVLNVGDPSLKAHLGATFPLHRLVHLTPAECSWLSSVMPPEKGRAAHLLFFGGSILQYLYSWTRTCNTTQGLSNLKSLYEVQPEGLGRTRRFSNLQSMALHSLKSNLDINTEPLYIEVLSSLFTQFPPKTEGESCELLALLYVNAPGYINSFINSWDYKRYLMEVKQILDSSQDLEKEKVLALIREKRK